MENKSQKELSLIIDDKISFKVSDIILKSKTKPYKYSIICISNEEMVLPESCESCCKVNLKIKDNDKVVDFGNVFPQKVRGKVISFFFNREGLSE